MTFSRRSFLYLAFSIIASFFSIPLAYQFKEPHFEALQPREITQPSHLEFVAATQVGGQADWRQWDSFFTFVVKRFGQDLTGDLRNSLGDVFLDSRYELTSAITPSRARSRDPVPELFLSSWKRLAPILNKSLPGLPKPIASQYASFIQAGDKLVAAGQIGFQTGLVKLSPDILRGMARIIEPGTAVDPVAFNLNVDSALRSLLGFGAPLAPPRPSSVQQSRLHKSYSPLEEQRALTFHSWFARVAFAAEPDVGKLNQWVPEDKELQPYLEEVRYLLAGVSDKVPVKSSLAEQYKPLYKHIVFATAWQESCWRQFIKKGKKLAPLSSATGDIGLMQVNRHTWRGVYDLKGLGGDIEYNGRAGGEILLYYLTRHAIKKNEDKHKEGNLARATYSAYNGGPSHLTRYRAAKRNPSLKKVDEAFWDKFQAVSSGRELEVQRCYKKQ